MKVNRAGLLLGGIIVSLLALSFGVYGAERGMQTLFQGATLASIIFLVAAGLSLIFGLMKVLNLSHGAIFMVAAYIGAVGMSNTVLLLQVGAHPLALTAGGLAGLVIGQSVINARESILDRRLRRPVMGSVAVIAALVAVAVWLGSSPNSLAPGQSVLPYLDPRSAVVVELLATIIMGIGLRLQSANARTQTIGLQPIIAAAAIAVAMFVGFAFEPLGTWIQGRETNLRFLIIVVIAVVAGAGLGLILETGLLRPLYGFTRTQVLMTFFVLLLLVEGVQLIFGRNTLTMIRPGFFDGRGDACPSTGLDIFLGGCASMQILGARTATYRIVILVVAAGLAALLIFALKRSREGMYIRAGVQDSAMVSALGVNIQQVFTRTFVVGSALAALGGVVAAPFLGVSSLLALDLLVDAIIVLLVGGLGSVGGALGGAMLIGMWTAFSDVTVLNIGLDPALTRTSTLLLMVAILIFRPTGLFGRSN
jgi:branched-chain amino acid transport system permease protein